MQRAARGAEEHHQNEGGGGEGGGGGGGGGGADGVVAAFYTQFSASSMCAGTGSPSRSSTASADEHRSRGLLELWAVLPPSAAVPASERTHHVGLLRQRSADELAVWFASSGSYPPNKAAALAKLTVALDVLGTLCTWPFGSISSTFALG